MRLCIVCVGVPKGKEQIRDTNKHIYIYIGLSLSLYIIYMRIYIHIMFAKSTCAPALLAGTMQGIQSTTVCASKKFKNLRPFARKYDPSLVHTY